MSSRQKIGLILSLLLATIFLALPQIRNGLNYQYGQGFWGPSGHDMIWHIALSHQASNPLQIQHPTYSGSLIQNYHPFYNLLVNWTSKITFISIPSLSFQVLPIIFSFLLVYLSFLLGNKLFGFNGGLLLIFLNTFSSSFGWIISLLRNQYFYGESIFWSMQSASTQTNPPYALSLIFILVGLLILLKNNLKRLDYIILFVISLLLPITKAYTAFVWFPLYIIILIINKSNLKKYLIFIVTAILSYLLFSYYNSGSSSLFELNPFWFIHTLIDSPDRLFLPRLSGLRFNIANIFDPRYLAIEIFTLCLFIAGNFSWRLIGFLKPKKQYQKIYYSLVPVILFLFLIPLLFTQKGNTWNSIQFLYYSLFLSNILLTAFLVFNLKKIKYQILLTIIIITSFIANVGTYQTYFGNPAPTSVYPPEIEALKFLSKQSKGIILTYPYNPYFKKSFNQTPIPLYVYETTAYVSAYTGFPVFLADEMNLQISGYDYQTRLDQVNKFYKQDSEFENRGLLVNNQIDYIYLVDKQIDNTQLDTLKMSLTKIFDNGYVNIYQVNR